MQVVVRDNNVDQALRALKKLSWDQPNASYYLQGRGYTEADVEHAVSQVMGKDMHAWFDKYVGGTDDINFDDVLALAGLRIDRTETRWTVTPMPDATSREIAIRDSWLADAQH